MPLAVQTSIFLAVAGLFFRRGDFMVSYVPKISELFLALAFLLFFIDLGRGRWREFAAFLKENSFAKPLALLTTSIIAGTAWQFLFVTHAISLANIVDFGRLVLVFATFVITLFYFRKKTFITENLPLAFAPVLIYFSAFFLSLHTLYATLHWIPLRGADRFEGYSNIIIFGNWVLTALLLFLAKIFGSNKDGRWQKIIFVFAAIGTAGLLWWTGTRSIWLAMFLGIGIMFFLMYKTARPRNIRGLAKKMVYAAAIIVAGLLIQPAQVKKDELIRIYPQYYARFGWYGSASSTTNFSDTFGEIVHDQALLKVDQGGMKIRLATTFQFLKKTLPEPFGFGVYYLYQKATVDTGTGIEQVGADSLFLEIITSGGLLALAAFCWLLAIIAKSLYRRLKSNPEDGVALGVAAAIVGLLFSSLFHFGLADRLIWILLAVAASRNGNARELYTH
jgi:O-Antigen ligase